MHVCAAVCTSRTSRDTPATYKRPLQWCHATLRAKRITYAFWIRDRCRLARCSASLLWRNVRLRLSPEKGKGKEKKKKKKKKERKERGSVISQLKLKQRNFPRILINCENWSQKSGHGTWLFRLFFSFSFFCNEISKRYFRIGNRSWRYSRV